MLQLLFVAVEMEQQSHNTNVIAVVGLQFQYVKYYNMLAFKLNCIILRSFLQLIECFKY